MSEEISWNKSKVEPVLGPHKDYPYNLKNAENFCCKVEKKMQPGMRAYISGSHGLEKSLLYISWKPPKEHPAGMYATPIFLHDSTSNVNKKIEGIFNAYMKKAQQWFERNPLQPGLFDPQPSNAHQKV